MKTIVVSDMTYALVANAAVKPFVSTGKQLPSGQWEVPVSDDVFEVLERLRFSNETIDDVIQRYLTTGRH